LSELGLHVAPTFVGLNNKTDLTLDELKEANVSMKRVKRAIDNKTSLIEVPHDVAVDLSSLDSLLEHATLVVRDGEVVIGSPFEIKEKDPLISRDVLIDLDWTFIRDEYHPILFDLFRSHVSLHGFFYPKVKDPLSDVLDDLSVASELVSCPRACAWLKAHARSFWEVDKGAVNAFSRDDVLFKVLAYRLSLNNSKPYVYKINSSRVVETRETFDINLRTVRKGFIVQRHSVSWFKPSYAAYVYREALKGIDNPVVWDPSVGFSARLLGFVSVVNKGKYIGTDPARAMFRDACSLRDALKTVRSDVDVQLINSGSEHVSLEPNSLDLVFTSPPYFDREKYYSESGQCWREYRSLSSWREKYVIPTLKNAHSSLKCGAKCVLNVNNELVDLFVNAALGVGFKHVGVLDKSISLNADHYIKHNNADKKRSEPFLVFEK
jgi:hypothetical protein